MWFQSFVVRSDKNIIRSCDRKTAPCIIHQKEKLNEIRIQNSLRQGPSSTKILLLLIKTLCATRRFAFILTDCGSRNKYLFVLSLPVISSQLHRQTSQ